jgi:hypothetical protein
VLSCATVVWNMDEHWKRRIHERENCRKRVPFDTEETMRKLCPTICHENLLGVLRRQRTPKSGVENQVASRSSVKLIFRRYEMLWVMSNDPVFQQNCLIRTCSNHVLIGKHDCVARAVVNPAELLAVIELSLSCMSWGLVAQFPFMKRTFVLARRGKAQSEDISAVRQSFWDDFCFFFLFSQCHKLLHILHHCSVTMSLFCAVVSPALVSKSPPWTVLHLSFA